MSVASLQQVALLIQKPRLHSPNLRSVAQSVPVSMIDATTPQLAPIIPSASQLWQASYARNALRSSTGQPRIFASTTSSCRRASARARLQSMVSR